MSVQSNEAYFRPPERADGRFWDGGSEGVVRPGLPEGAAVVFHGASQAQVRWGGCADPNPVFALGEEAEVDRLEVHSMHTKLFVKGRAGGFPSGAFHVKGTRDNWRNAEEAAARSARLSARVAEVYALDGLCRVVPGEGASDG